MDRSGVARAEEEEVRWSSESDGRERRNRVERLREERAVEPEERDDEDGVDSSDGARRTEGPRAHTYIPTRHNRGVWSSSYPASYPAACL